jgi:hypothetical protein
LFQYLIEILISCRPPWCAEGEKEEKTTKREAAHRRKKESGWLFIRGN